MKRFTRFNLSLILLLFTINPLVGQGTVSDLRNNGYTIFPAPQQVDLEKGTTVVDETWKLLSERATPQEITEGLIQRAQELHSLNFTGSGSGQIDLKIKKDAVTGISDPDCSRQAYRITIKKGGVTIEGNEEAGLFYGVQSFLQLLKPTSGGKFQLPLGTITDWPDLELRFIHWDTKHHRDRIETLKRYIDWSAYFKVNAIAFELEDKYQYPTHPVIGGPNAFSKAQIQELTRYALERYIQLVPNVQAPAHMGYVLKHKEFKHLRAEEVSNFQACMCDEEAIELIFDMYQDMIDATPGVDYFFVSTDEVYYAGICDKCKREYNDANRSQIWVDYLKRVNEWMSKRSRKVLAWVEYPLLPEDISQVPSDVIDAIMSANKNQEWVNNETVAGIRQLSYSSMQGSEYLFPNYFPTDYRGRPIKGRLRDAYDDVRGREADGANLIGTFAAAWDDSGLHNETFWLGWATVTQYGWTKSTPSIEQNIADFMDVFYGADSPDMVEVYMLLEEGARFYEALWDKVPTKEREKGYGNSFGKGVGGDFSDLVLHMPPLPSIKDLSLEPSFQKKYNQKIEEASALRKKNELLILHLMRNVTRVRHNSYNLEVLLSIAFLERYAMETVLNLAKVEDDLVEASKTGKDYAKGVNLLIEAHQRSGKILKKQDEMWSDLIMTWEKSRHTKGRSVGGRDFYHAFDDVKDHFADRRKGLEYMLAPFERMGIEDWRRQLATVINEYAALHTIPVKGMEAGRLED